MIYVIYDSHAESFIHFNQVQIARAEFIDPTYRYY